MGKMVRYALIAGVLALLPTILSYNAYALGAPQPLSKPPTFIITYITILLAVIFYMFLQQLIRRSFYSHYKLTQ